MSLKDNQIFFTSSKTSPLLLSLAMMMNGVEVHVKLFHNKRHKPGDKYPCMTGTMIFAGEEAEVAIWAPKEGKKSYSGIIKPIQDKKTEGEARSQSETVSRPYTEAEPVSPPVVNPEQRRSLLR
jgi:hypothetical protein